MTSALSKSQKWDGFEKRVATNPRSPRICAQYGFLVLALAQTLPTHELLTPARTRDMSKTLIPVRGNLGVAAVALPLLLKAERQSGATSFLRMVNILVKS